MSQAPSRPRAVAYLRGDFPETRAELAKFYEAHLAATHDWGYGTGFPQDDGFFVDAPPPFLRQRTGTALRRRPAGLCLNLRLGRGDAVLFPDAVGRTFDKVSHLADAVHTFLQQGLTIHFMDFFGKPACFPDPDAARILQAVRHYDLARRDQLAAKFERELDARSPRPHHRRGRLPCGWKLTPRGRRVLDRNFWTMVAKLKAYREKHNLSYAQLAERCKRRKQFHGQRWSVWRLKTYIGLLEEFEKRQREAG